MASPGTSSTLGNLVAQRQKLSGIRQRLGLESGPGSAGMRELAPSPASGPAPVRGHAMAATQDQPDMSWLDNHQLDPEKENKMLDNIQGWIDANNNGIDDRTEGSSPEQQGAKVDDPRAMAALSPLADFYRENGRLPNMEELQHRGATNQVKAQLGRDPTPDEVNLYRQQPPKEVKADKPNAN